jgi:hypothetical protein
VENFSVQNGQLFTCKKQNLFPCPSLGFFFSIFVLLAIHCTVVGCGRYAAPEPPEFYSPMGIRLLFVRPQVNGVEFTWESPEADLRGRELESMDGYRIYRKPFLLKADLIELEDYDEVGFVEDTHVLILEERRKAAIEKGIPSRKVSIEPELKSFRYLDTGLVPGQSYLYKLTPVNQGGVEGQTDTIVKILFRGLNSEVQMVGVRGGEAMELPGENTLLEEEDLSASPAAGGL